MEKYAEGHDNLGIIGYRRVFRTVLGKIPGVWIREISRSIEAPFLGMIELAQGLFSSFGRFRGYRRPLFTGRR